MDYHEDRFDDFSLLVYKNKRLIAVLPANRVGNKVYSHQGLSYGGLILLMDVKFIDVYESFKAIVLFCIKNQVNSLTLKFVPIIYHKLPSDEQDYLMFLFKGKLIRRDLSSAIEYSNKLKINSNRIEGKKKALKNDLVLKKEPEFEAFWNSILVPNLEERHQSKPVHTLDEIELLHSKFKENISQFNVYKNGEIVAGATIFETPTVAHVQYISANKDKQQLGSLDFLFENLINVIYSDKKYFDFGISNENQGRNINKGLLFWKEGFGARAIKHDFYELDLLKIKDFETVFI